MTSCSIFLYGLVSKLKACLYRTTTLQSSAYASNQYGFLQPLG